MKWLFAIAGHWLSKLEAEDHELKYVVFVMLVIIFARVVDYI